MSGPTLLRRDWKSHLANLIGNAKDELLISSPYITREGVALVSNALSTGMRVGGHLTILTDLSPLNVAMGSTEPEALQILTMIVPNARMKHLPRLHAKVYVADLNHAIVTSGNLTAGGINLNYEYGVSITTPLAVRTIKQDITAYAGLGADVNAQQLIAYCQLANKVRAAFRKERTAAAKSVRHEFKQALSNAEDELIRLRLAEGATHTIFEKTVLYLLDSHSSLTTQEIHSMIEAIHPDLCDNTIDRIIDGKRFGKKWKHAVRTAQQHLKKRGLIELKGNHWRRS